MREIKFRAFSKEYGMTLPFLMSDIQDGFAGEFQFNNGSYLCVNEFDLKNPKTIIMQYSGLKDNAGTEIYEGDVVEVVDIKNWTGVVSFMSGAFVIVNPNCCKRCANGEGCVGGVMELGIDRVIGNRFENPELLESKDK